MGTAPAIVDGDGYADIAVGAPDKAFRGFVVVYHGGPGGIPSGGSSTAATTLTATQIDIIGGVFTDFGLRMASGDFDADGYSDLAVASRGYGESQPDDDNGAVYVFPGGPNGIADGNEDSAA